MRKSDKQLTPNLRRHIFEFDIDVSGTIRASTQTLAFKHEPMAVGLAL
jgi:hypothetical protein